MFNKKFRMIISLCLVLLICFAGTVSASAAEALPMSAEEVFPEEQVKALQEKNATLPLYYDKDDMGSCRINSTRASGTYPTRKGVILVTDDKYKGLLPTGHAAIIYSSTRVVESLENGVVMGANDWNTSKSTCYGVTVRGTTISEDASAATWCYRQLGKAYNFNYFNTGTRTKFYCSQLVWAAFYDNYGIDLSTSAFGSAIHPSELVDSSNTYTIYSK